MNKELLIQFITKKIKLIRTEKGYTQDKMAEILGISKKTLVQIEKGRIPANWTLSVAVCALFRDSEILQSKIGGDPVEMVETLVHEGIERPKDKTMGGKIWWKDIEEKGKFRLQQNLISKHYRILDEEDYRWYSSFNKEEAFEHLENLYKMGTD